MNRPISTSRKIVGIKEALCSGRKFRPAQQTNWIFMTPDEFKRNFLDRSASKVIEVLRQDEYELEPKVFSIDEIQDAWDRACGTPTEATTPYQVRREITRKRFFDLLLTGISDD
jgi:hypothetical protein